MNSLTSKKYESLTDSFMFNAFGIGAWDFGFMLKYYDTVSNQVDLEMVNELVASPNDINANHYIYEIFCCINSEVFGEIKNQLNDGCIENLNIDQTDLSELVKACDDRISEFSPFINCIDSWFNNELDEVVAYNTSIDEIVKDVLPIFIENVIRGES